MPKRSKEVQEIYDRINNQFEYQYVSDEDRYFIKSIEGTDPYWFLIAVLVQKCKNVDDLEKRVKELEEVMENMRGSFKRKNEYGY